MFITILMLLLNSKIAMADATPPNPSSLLITPAQTTIPDLPPSPCYEGCTEYMQQLVDDFANLGRAPSLEPFVYSGECRHLGGGLGPDQIHYSTVLIDRLNEAPLFSTIFSYFAQQNDFADWDLVKARAERDPEWKRYGLMKSASGAARVEVLDANGAPAYVYWLRQNPATGELYYITYAGGTYQKSFCRLKPHLH
ncbi:MAG: hypothetical protein AB7N80_03505 [Bdellovibrionales bacterium]